MNKMVAETAFNPQLVISILRANDGEFPFSDLLQALERQGLNESYGRELIWQTLAQGLIEFSPDRSTLRMFPGHEGRVA
jgi:hypothetical protein